jgi:hypothetical protein
MKKNNSYVRYMSLMRGSSVPKYIRIYDNGGKTFDRYTAIYTGKYRNRIGNEFEKGWFQHRAMSANPFHPQGVGISGESATQIDVNKWGFAPMVGKSNHLGKRINFSDLPMDCQQLVISDYKEIWGLK